MGPSYAYVKHHSRHNFSDCSCRSLVHLCQMLLPILTWNDKVIIVVNIHPSSLMAYVWLFLSFPPLFHFYFSGQASSQKLIHVCRLMHILQLQAADEESKQPLYALTRTCRGAGYTQENKTTLARKQEADKPQTQKSRVREQALWCTMSNLNCTWFVYYDQVAKKIRVLWMQADRGWKAD